MKDTQLFESVERELNRQRNNIELIASENFVSEEVLQLAQLLQINMLKDIQQKDIMGDVNLLMKLKNLQDKEFVKSMGQNMLMFNHIVGHKLILQFI